MRTRDVLDPAYLVHDLAVSDRLGNGVVGPALRRHGRRSLRRRRAAASPRRRGRVTFNVELLHEPASLRRRVIVEELLHLKVPNHGKLFQALLKAYLGGKHAA